jgi:hypothetical protein
VSQTYIGNVLNFVENRMLHQPLIIDPVAMDRADIDIIDGHSGKVMEKNEELEENWYEQQ